MKRKLCATIIDGKMGEKGKFVFVVEDNETTRNMIRDYLARKGFQVKTVEDGLDVLVFLRYHKPDLIISDIRMPKCDGFTLLEGLKNRQETRDIPVIFMSGLDNQETFNKAEKLGAKHFLVKPFPPSKLLDAVNQVFDNNDDELMLNE